MILHKRCSSIHTWYVILLIGLHCSSIPNVLSMDCHEASVTRSNCNLSRKTSKGPNGWRCGPQKQLDISVSDTMDNLKSDLRESEDNGFKEGDGAGQASGCEQSTIRLHAMLKLEDIFGKKLNIGSKKKIPSLTLKEPEKVAIFESVEGADVEKWERKGLCVHWIALIAKQINLQTKNSFMDIEDQTDEKNYNSLKYLWQNSSSNMIAEERQLHIILGEFEATRRINALRHRLYRYTLAENWKAYRDSLRPRKNKKPRKSDMNTADMILFEIYFGVSCNPGRVNDYLLLRSLRIRKGLSETYKSALATVFCESEQKRWG
ncbi:hypothetical protein PCASD_26590 [Puccinia coronata f. sp. avenae]|uniref:Uncharacterized protein n=1 Tax=Puccinia coronata f. sp. avenae TaxID=200324 RepID=A0A2N5THU1_9BASI|nr:hypothetical protein PCASD_26590 [Puccinia coronata f. sp. avenae]